MEVFLGKRVIPSKNSYGHSHKYSLAEKDGRIWFNPGCCGKRKPEQEVSFALLEISGPGEFEFEKRVIDNAGQDSKLPKDIDRIISKAMDMTGILQRL